MRMFEVFDGDKYQFTVMPSEEPRAVLQAERYKQRNPRLRMVMVENGERTEVEGPADFEPVLVLENDDDDGEYITGYFDA